MLIPKNFTLKTLMITGLFAVILSGCAKPKNPDDPLENFNRHMFNINRGIDMVVFKPVGYLYFKGVPGQLRLGISNIFSNLALPTVFANDILQGEFHDAAHDMWRMIINSTFGVLGIFDVASKIGLGPRTNDFGKTLYKWGVTSAPYLVLPVIGSTNFRDMIGTAVDYTAFTPSIYLDVEELYFSQLGYRLFDNRVFILTADNFIKEAFDPYIFVRNAYLQKRNNELGKIASKSQATKTGAQIDTSQADAQDPFVEWPEEVPVDETAKSSETATDSTPSPEQPTTDTSTAEQPATNTSTPEQPVAESAATEQPPAQLIESQDVQIDAPTSAPETKNTTEPTVTQ